ncbi:hypothetical protein THAOC_15463, partial [Thalassiosira oceanica]
RAGRGHGRPGEDGGHGTARGRARDREGRAGRAVGEAREGRGRVREGEEGGGGWEGRGGGKGVAVQHRLRRAGCDDRLPVSTILPPIARSREVLRLIGTLSPKRNRTGPTTTTPRSRRFATPSCGARSSSRGPSTWTAVPRPTGGRSRSSAGATSARARLSTWCVVSGGEAHPLAPSHCGLIDIALFYSIRRKKNTDTPPVIRAADESKVTRVHEQDAGQDAAVQL